MKIELNKKEKEQLLHFANVNYKVKENEIALEHQKETSKQNMLLGVSCYCIISITTYYCNIF